MSFLFPTKTQTPAPAPQQTTTTSTPKSNNVMTQQQVEATLRPLGFTGSATGGAAQAFINSNPAAQQAMRQASQAAQAAATQSSNQATTSGTGTQQTNTTTQQPTLPARSPTNQWNEQTATEVGQRLGLLRPGEVASNNLLEERARLANMMNTLRSIQAQAGVPMDEASYKTIVEAAQKEQAAMPVDQYMSGLIQNPQIPGMAQMSYLPQQIGTGEMLQGQGAMIQGTQVPQAQPIAAPTLGQAAQAQATETSAQEALQYFNPATGKYEAMTISGQTPQGEAAQGTVNPLATVKGQLEQLYAESQPGEIPDWARGAVTNANDVMAARGMARSTIGIGAIAAAIQQSALPIAAADAATYFQMDLKNLDNRQQMALTNIQMRQQSLLSDQAATNAASQFNATSESQTQQFMASLVSQIKEQNAARKTAINQFNTQSENQFKTAEAELLNNTNQFNAQMRTQVQAFNANVELQRQQFNATNAFAIEQSNVLWRRSINTANTAGQNAANQTNALNAFNLSTSALNNLWQQLRDQQSWLNTAAESEKDRQFQLYYLANQQQFAQDQGKFNWGKAVGTVATEIVKDMFV